MYNASRSTRYNTRVSSLVLRYAALNEGRLASAQVTTTRVTAVNGIPHTAPQQNSNTRLLAY